MLLRKGLEEDAKHVKKTGTITAATETETSLICSPDGPRGRHSSRIDYPCCIADHFHLTFSYHKIVRWDSVCAYDTRSSATNFYSGLNTRRAARQP